MHLEKRNGHREVLHIPVLEIHPEHCESGMIINMSENGLCYYKSFSQKNTTAGPLILSFRTCDSSIPINVSAEILHQYNFDDKVLTGIVFKKLSDESRSMIKSQVSRFLPESGA